MSNNIILIGFMGCGKTTFGKWIAKNKKMKFVDTDEIIEKNEQCTINEIFKNRGEEVFRNMETEVIKKLLDTAENSVISAGGGLPVKHINRGLLKELGTVVYLRTPKEELVKRLLNDTSRPLLKGGNIEQKIDTLMSLRKDIYEETADIIIDTTDREFDKMYELIRQRESGK